MVLKELKIRDIKLKNRLFLAPMVDVTDVAYRTLCRRAGAAIAYTEMINIGAITHTNKKTLDMLKTARGDKPVGLQITGRNVEEFREVVKRPEIKPFDLIDINCGCPSMRITGNASGSYLLNNPKQIGEMIKILKETGKPVTAKIRLGYRKNNVLKTAKIVEKAGADLLTLHARLANQGSSIPANWKEIRRIKKNIGIPLIGNGDVFNGEDVAKMLDICDGAMIARGAIGNPLVFREMLRYLRTGKEREIKPSEKIKQFKDYLELVEKHDVVDIGRIKYLGGKFLTGFKGAAKERMDFVRLDNLTKMKKKITSLKLE